VVLAHEQHHAGGGVGSRPGNRETRVPRPAGQIDRTYEVERPALRDAGRLELGGRTTRIEPQDMLHAERLPIAGRSQHEAEARSMP
jgi:hypothetical protein